MNHSCLTYDYKTGQIICSIYVILFVIGLSGNIVCGLSIIRSKLWFVPTYFFIINQCLADVLCLICIGFYTGFELFTVSPCSYVSDSSKYRTDKVMTFLLQMGWYPSGYFAVLLAFSRLIALKYNITYTQSIKKRHLLSAAFGVWAAVLGYYDVREFDHANDV
uniref:G-protein coupled receptors family 1 profile domain-containing protein n=1 Tax=Romanomermis culicivorax TaxID=13658 RepID=A0A915IIG6_ROMCU